MTLPMRSAVLVAALCCGAELTAQSRPATTSPVVDSDVAALYRMIAARAGVRPLTGPESDTIRFEFRAFRFNHSALRPTLIIRAEPSGYQGYRIEPPGGDKTHPVGKATLSGDWGERVRQLERLLILPPVTQATTGRNTDAPTVRIDGVGLAIEWRRGAEYRVWWFSSDLPPCPSASEGAKDTKPATIEEYVCAWLGSGSP
jgi:hypothetical protein